MTYSVENIIQCKKSIQRIRRINMKLDNRHLRGDIDLVCDLPDIKLVMFLRRLQFFPEDFTVGLRIETPNPFLDSSIVLLRFQGPHGGHISPDGDIHNSYHIHYYSEDDLRHRRKKASVANKLPGTFNSYDEAVVQFLEYCNIKDPNGIFAEERSRLHQMQLCFLS